MKKILFTLVLTSFLNSSAHGMWRTVATRLAGATKYARKHMPAYTKPALRFAHATAKPAQKPLIRATLKPQQSQSSFWDRLSNSFASAWQRLKQNFKVPQWLKNSTAQEQIKKIVKSYAQTVSTRAPLIGGAMAATAVKTAYAQGKDHEMPAFTADAIFTFRFSMQHRSAFIAHAVQNITAKDTETIEAITAMLEQYPESHVPITQAALAAFNDVQPEILKTVLAHNAWAKDDFIYALIAQDNPHLEKLLNRNQDYISYDWKFCTHPGGTIYSLGQLILKDEFKDLIKKRLKLDSCQMGLKELIYLHYLNNSWAVRDLYQLLNPLKFPQFLYDAPSTHLICESLRKNSDTIPTQYLEYAYYEILNKNEKKMLKKTMTEQALPIYRTHLLNAILQGYNDDIPFFMRCTAQNHQATQSEKHFCDNVSSIIEWLRRYDIKKKSNAIPMFKRAITKEREELAKGNHVFYHGRKWEYDFWADMDKMTYNLVHPHNPLADIRLRFGDSEEALERTGLKYALGGSDGALCLNYALFANTTNSGSNTASYVLNDSDFSSASGRFNLNWLFSQFNLQKHFNHYKKEFEKLKTMHESCNNHGSLLMISIPDKHLGIVYPAQAGSMGQYHVSRKVNGKKTTNVRTILNALKTDPSTIQNGNSDYIEFALRITPQLKDKVRIYPMSQADPAKYKEYTDYRDQLFAQIKTDIEKGKK